MSTTPAKLPTWHAGETYLQERLGVAERMAIAGERVIRDYMPDQHRDFYAQLPFIVLGAVDPAGDPWATLLAGRPGFMTSPTPTTLDIAARPDTGDPAGAGMGPGDSVGLLGIEMHTRRRNRMNGIVGPRDGGFRVEVDQSFGNCPRYIQLRDVAGPEAPAAAAPAAVEELVALDAPAQALIAAADTFFVATYADRDGRRQVDVSHRGGKAGFVRLGPDGTLTVPDFNGNLFFSTLGNIVLNGRAGLVFVDYATGDLLQLTGEAAVLLESAEIAAFQGAERLWTFHPRRILRQRGALPLRWTFQADGWSPSALMTGDWAEAAARLGAAALATAWRPYEVTRIVEETASIRSFHLRPADGAGPVPHAAGQHLPIRVTVPGAAAPAIRTYTLSVAPSDGFYRISVKREGVVSRHLHDHVRVGDVIEARAPAGQFTIDTDATRPAVLLAGGVGITPLLAMLRHVVYEGQRRQRMRRVVLVQAARSQAEMPFGREIAALVRAAEGSVSWIRVLGDPDGAVEARDYDVAGRIDMVLLKHYLAFDDYDFYLCGPPPFTQALYDGLRQLAVGDRRIHAEAFGPSSLKRLADASAAPAAPRAAPSTVPVAVTFVDSLKEARWAPGAGTLLELAEARGLTPEFGCREGSCGTCRTRLLGGAVTYVRETGAGVADGEVLICSAVPAEAGPDGENRIQLAL